jgi:hypothetical protein
MSPAPFMVPPPEIDDEPVGSIGQKLSSCDAGGARDSVSNGSTPAARESPCESPEARLGLS